MYRRLDKRRSRKETSIAIRMLKVISGITQGQASHTYHIVHLKHSQQCNVTLDAFTASLVVMMGYLVYCDGSF